MAKKEEKKKIEQIMKDFGIKNKKKKSPKK